MVTFLLVVTMFFIVLSIFLKIRYVAIIYVVGNIILFIFFTVSGQVGVWFILLFQISALGPAFLGICIGTPIGYKVRPIIGSKLSNFGNELLCRLSAGLRKKQDLESVLNFDGTPKNSENIKREDLLADKRDIKSKY
ncbi:hypothetical protein [Shewanella dokdonensis]|uniref:Uncharacterized protein n=1 Tax=Shewanella dokdonensis TaxID=712036 RepID=A0ABX8DE64_9GAMM|nr:hypothetical protein [Shewanella dokdonensis]MCL1073104.1 hypothetical protein [Shewanella dokdonensis]QVK23013.1 hypothetical protein KHX94_18095 [Shewanella dokdonensis]